MDADRVVGTNVAGYAIEAVLGRGAMGIVYLARQRSPDRKVALKLLAPALSDDDVFRKRFLAESSAAAAIDHPHVLPIYDAGESDGVLFISMRLVEGQDLREILRSHERLDLPRVVTIVGQIGEALDAAHARGLVHRDVKPGNILVARQGDADDPPFCYLTDFGVSMWTTSSGGTLTSTDRMVGTMNYAAPEQIEGTRVDGRADLYSLGCVLYECIVGRSPFAGRSPAGILYAQLHEEPPPPTSLRADLPAALDLVVERSLKKKPDERYGSGRALTLELRDAVGGQAPAPSPAIGPAPSPAGGPRMRGPLVIAAAIVAVLVVAVATFAIADHPGGTHPSTSGRAPSGLGSAQLLREGVQVTASSTAPASKDAAGHVVTYLPGNVIDGDVQTAWRTHGNGRGVTLTLLFDGPVDIVRIGLIPGYAKTDPDTGVSRFDEDRIISKVVYLIPGLPPTTKEFRPFPFPQFVDVSAAASRIMVKILDTTRSGGKNYTAISEVYVYGFPQ